MVYPRALVALLPELPRTAHCGDHRASQVPGEPRYVHAPLPDPGGIAAPDPLGASDAVFRSFHVVDSHNWAFEAHSRGLHVPCVRFTHAVARARATLGSGCGSALPGGIDHPLGSIERFPPPHIIRSTYMASPFPRLGLAHGTSPAVPSNPLALCVP